MPPAKPLQIPQPLPIVPMEVWGNPEKLFFFLSRWTVTHGFERGYYHAFLTDLGFAQDEHGNYFQIVEGENGERPTTAFMAHLDTASCSNSPIELRWSGSYLCTDGSSILGADDRAGIVTLLTLIYHGVPGAYWLFLGEERGCVGSGKAAKHPERFEGIERAICFDRRGTDSLVTHQMSERCCSPTFAEALAGHLNAAGFHYKPDSTGCYTDNREFTHFIPEATNLSIGYEGAHTAQERQDIDFLIQFCEAAVNIPWETLPTERDPAVTETLRADRYDHLKNGYGKQTYYGYGVEIDAEAEGWELEELGTAQTAKEELDFVDGAELSREIQACYEAGVCPAYYKVLDLVANHPDEASDLLFALLRGTL